MLLGDTRNVIVKKKIINCNTTIGDREERGGPDANELLHVLIHGQTKITNFLVQGQKHMAQGQQ